ncbi:MAG: hypothetical protein IKO94_03210 [Selenomonadaceae bacterium]|nr:hypothetical protein [Selenomonadaceae bacterium]
MENHSIELDDGASKMFLSTKGTLNDVTPEVKNFLDFVDGLPVKDPWIDEVQNLIAELKHMEKEKVDYMTYQIKIAEERAEAMAKGRAEGEARLSRLIAHLIEIGKNDQILSVTQSPAIRNQLYEKYSIV